MLRRHIAMAFIRNTASLHLAPLAIMAAHPESSAITVKTTPVSIEIKRQICMHVDDLNESHPNISSLTARIIVGETPAIGYITAQILRKGSMEAIGPCRLWGECQAYDAAHGPTSKMNKVETILPMKLFH